MRLSVRQRWCSLLSETVWPQHHYHRYRYRTQSRCLPPTPPYEAHSRRQFSSSAVFSDSPLAVSVLPAQPPTTNAAPPLSPAPPASADVLYHQAVVLAASAARLGHPHAVIAVVDSLRQQTYTASLNHPALHNHLLRAYLHCDTISPHSRYSKMRDVWEGMQADKVRCNRQTYALLLNGCINKHRQLLQEEQTQHSLSLDTTTASATQHPPPAPSCLQECLDLVKDVPLSTFICNLLIKAALLSNNHSYPFRLFQHCFPPLTPNSATLSLLVDTALSAPAATPRDGVIKAMEWYNRVRETSKQTAATAVAGTPAMYAKLMRRCLQYSEGTQEVQHVPVLFSHMEEAGLRVDAEHIRCLVLALSRLQLRGVGWRVWSEMESSRRVQRTDETDALMLRVMSEEQDFKRAMEVINSIQQRWATHPLTTPSAPSSSAVSNYRSALSNIARNGNSATLLVLLSHVFSSSRYSSAVLRDGMLESVVRRWKEAGRSVDELRAKVRQWVAAADVGEQEMAAWQSLAALLSQRAQRSKDEVDALALRTLSKSKDHDAAMQLILHIEQRWASTTPSLDSSPTALSSPAAAYYRSALYNVAGHGSAVLLLTLLSHVFSSRYCAAVLRGGKLVAVVRRWRESGRSADELLAQVRQWQAAVDLGERETEGWRALTALLATQTSNGTTQTTSPHSLQHKAQERQQQQQQHEWMNGALSGKHEPNASTKSASGQLAVETVAAPIAPVSISSRTIQNGSKRTVAHDLLAQVPTPGYALSVVADPSDRLRVVLSAAGGAES